MEIYITWTWTYFKIDSAFTKSQFTVYSRENVIKVILFKTASLRCNTIGTFPLEYYVIIKNWLKDYTTVS